MVYGRLLLVPFAYKLCCDRDGKNRNAQQIRLPSGDHQQQPASAKQNSLPEQRFVAKPPLDKAAQEHHANQSGYSAQHNVSNTAVAEKFRLKYEKVWDDVSRDAQAKSHPPRFAGLAPDSPAAA